MIQISPPLDICLDIIQTYGPSSPVFRDFFTGIRHDLMTSTDAAIWLVAATESADANDDVILLFSTLLDESRMSTENGNTDGRIFLEHVEIAINNGMTTSAFDASRKMMIAGLYRRASLPVPEILLIRPEQMNFPDVPLLPSAVKAHLEMLAHDIRAEGGGAFDLYSELSETVAAMPEEVQAGFIHYLTSLDEVMFERCALYWLLSGTPLMQEAAALGLSEKLKHAGLTTDTLFYLPVIRAWLEAGPLRDMIDRINREARRKNQGDTPEQPFGEILTIKASITDGVGAQSIIFRGVQENTPFVACILTKTGHGIKDAFVAPCRSKREADSIVRRIVLESNGATIDVATAELLLATALADGVENKKLPSPGFIDVMTACQLNELRPQKQTLPELLAVADPTGKISQATPHKTRQYLNHEKGMTELIPVMECWFEDSTEIRNITAGSGTRQKKETALWSHFEGRRNIWARRFLQTALMLKNTSAKNVLIVSASALMKNSPLPEIPLMADVVFNTMQNCEFR